MSLGTIWTSKNQRSGRAIRATAVLGGLEVNLPEAYVHRQDNQTSEFKAKFPHGKIPAWEGRDGFTMFESTPIAKYLASLAPNSGLLGGNATEVALVDQWIHFADTEIEVPQQFVNYTLVGFYQYSKPVHNIMVERIARALATVNEHLASRTYLVTERITVADLVVAAIVQNAASCTFDAVLRKKLPNVVRHMETIVNHPKLKEIYGPTEYTEKVKHFVAPPKERKEKAS
ncbi:glutathione S-transferase C-terminal-like protein [Athelia psychrophila]|uniref:Glutathione S-transferase C-terminal-like protein n=1 Tax=Athelia psychrophila TaxID=1759441 RepID=A0A166VY85_9AGAM|nr:glutathione S-transferase C-terminal-like protein [Fibularhizoctonia sp. CBS 109695]